MIIKLINKNKA